MRSSTSYRGCGLVARIPLWLHLAIAAIAAGPGCFRGADLSKIICNDSKYCPKGSVCVIPLGQEEGTCQRLVDSGEPTLLDGAVAIDGAGGLDGATLLDGVVDQPTGGIDQWAGRVDAADDPKVDGSATEDVPLPTLDGPRVDAERPIDGAGGSGGSGGSGMDTTSFGGTGGFAVDAETVDAGGSCQYPSDCSSCQTCSAGHLCVTVQSQDDPSGHCAGTCDSTGSCKSKPGQPCSTATNCAGEGFCADGVCCDSACTGTCQACDVAGKLGTCTTLAAGASPHAGHGSCSPAGTTCGSSCDGSSPSCSYVPSNGQTCSSASCPGGNYKPAGTCNTGGCNSPATQTCAGTNQCLTYSCDPASGCTSTAKSCTGTDQCLIYSCDPASGCTTTAKSCTGSDQCLIYSCNSASGCTSTPRNCSGNNLCYTYSCNSASGCTSTAKNCGSSDTCMQRGCNTATGCWSTPNADGVHCGSTFCSGDSLMIPQCSGGVCNSDIGTLCSAGCNPSTHQCM
jgi:hypothetical protein